METVSVRCNVKNWLVANEDPQLWCVQNEGAETCGWLEDTLEALGRVPLEGCMRSTRNPRDYHTTNCRAVLRYLHTLEDYREACYKLNGVDAMMAKPEASLVES